ncbi:hypothetical protein DTO013E5_1043 [Penicillium roqueforti]|uniref:uncharacterized protein n=1 Tax=Penicillium roqueforti TaxID=5082 RepID=UPI00190ADF3B|nr:uncharacterized protein LCP9604111_1930 [Penicillium roqueforti]KAF9251934.1 hypothetical protein LCP9604111_1930 [Penicillium roqueforti]KAI2687640.1 hypothetical protein LCP963914a_3158 [Penicillium roqueforti]KAI2690007.1 hypothetical protein CBS147355_458 [Penicillium roqueforti]KAI2702529.1 hypothetical protein CBS147372_4262 [Penicillium roqueforti]KAI2721388.1 hypothetical protein CBS147318_2003 [Penicillium roqueforti]
MTGPFARNVIGFVIDINLGNRKLIRFSGAIIPLSLRITRSHKPAFRFQTICTIVHCSARGGSTARRDDSIIPHAYIKLPDSLPLPRHLNLSPST